MSNKAHGLNIDDVVDYEKYLDDDKAHNSADTAPTLIPVLDGSNITMKSYDGELTRGSKVLEGAQEGLTDALRTINTDHGYIHEGIGYKAYLEIGSLTGTEEFLIMPNEMKYLHFKNLVLQALGGTVKVSIRRGTTANPLVIDSEGVAATELTGPSNLNDNSSNTSGVTVTKTPTYVDTQNGEDWVIIQVLGDATNQFTSIAQTQTNDNEELVFKKNTPYVVKIEKIGADTPENVFISTFWYEEGEGVVT